MVPALRVVRHTLQGGGHVPTAARGVETGGLLTTRRLIGWCYLLIHYNTYMLLIIGLKYNKVVLAMYIYLVLVCVYICICCYIWITTY